MERDSALSSFFTRQKMQAKTCIADMSTTNSLSTCGGTVTRSHTRKCPHIHPPAQQLQSEFEFLHVAASLQCSEYTRISEHITLGLTLASYHQFLFQDINVIFRGINVIFKVKTSKRGIVGYSIPALVQAVCQASARSPCACNFSVQAERKSKNDTMVERGARKRSMRW
jgi:hypothetical protein